MKKNKRIKIIILACLLIISLLFFILNLKDYKIIGTRIHDMFDINNLKNWFNLGGVTDEVNNNASSFLERFNGLYMRIFGTWTSLWFYIKKLLEWLLLALVFILQIVSILASIYIIGMLFFGLFVIRKNKKYNMTMSARVYWQFNIFIVKVFSKIFGTIKKYYLSYKKQWIIGLILILTASGFIPRLIVELLIILETWIIALLKNELLPYLFYLIKWVLYQIVKLFTSINLLGKILIAYVVMFVAAIISGYRSLDKMHNKKKMFVKTATGQTTIINGAPGTGKTVNIVDMCIMAEEIYIDELEDNIFSFEVNNPSLNLALFRLDNVINDGKVKFDYLDKKTRKMLIAFRREIATKDDYSNLLESYDKLYYRDGFCVTNFSVKDPFFNGDFSHKLFIETLRMYKKQKTMSFESYMVIGITEADKEWNSHDDKGEIKDEGVASAFGLISQATDRKVKIFCDYQNKDQLIKRIRANSETFITLRELNFKCTRLVKIIKKPLDFLMRFNTKLIKMYEGRKKRVCKNTSRKGLTTYKRNDYTLFYAILRKWAFLFDKLDNYFSRFYYMEHIGEIANNDDMKDAKTFKTYTCIRDLSYNNEKLFDSCMFGTVYDDLREIIQSDKYLRDIPHWQSASPTLQEYLEIDMRFYNKIFKAQTNNDSNDEVKKEFENINL